jgi:hypothetical protein
MNSPKSNDLLISLAADIKVIANDVRWLKDDNIRRNSKFEKHLDESDKFRHRVTRNTVWRIIHHLMFVGSFSAMGYLFYLIIFVLRG